MDPANILQAGGKQKQEQNLPNVFSSINPCPVLSVKNFDYLSKHKNNGSKNAFQSNLFVVPTVKFEDEKIMKGILRSQFPKRRRKDHSLWLIGIKMQGESDDKSIIKERFSFLNLDYDDDVFVFMGEHGLGWRLYEIYKISENDKDIIVLPFGKWLPDGNLVVDQPEKYIRRKNLMVIRSEVYDTAKYM